MNPTPSIHELHLTFLLWKKLLGENSGLGEDYKSQLLEYEYNCLDDIDVGDQLGRIHDVRDVDDAKPYCDSEFINGKNISFIRAGLCTPDEGMQPYEHLFNDYSLELREKIHVHGLDPKKLAHKHAKMTQILREANPSLFIKLDFALQRYEQIDLGRGMGLEDVIFDNVALEGIVGKHVAKQGRSYQEEFHRVYNQDWFEIMLDDGSRLDIVDDIIFGMDDGWKYTPDNILVLVNEDPFVAARVMKNLSNERNNIYDDSIFFHLGVDFFE